MSRPGDERIWADDSEQWALQVLRMRKPKGGGEKEPYWESFKWYPTLESAARATAERWARKALLAGEVSDLKEAMLHGVQTLSDALPGGLEITVQKKQAQGH